MSKPPTLASTFAAIVNARLLPTQDRVDLARHLLITGQVQVTTLALNRAISAVMTADLAATKAWYEAHDRTAIERSWT